MSNDDLHLWNKLQQAGLVSGQMPVAQIEHHPWYLRLLQGFSGWFAAWFLLGSVFVIFRDFVQHEQTAFMLGVLSIAGAYYLYKVNNSDFTGQFALAISLTGQCLCIFSWHDLLKDSSGWLLVALMAAVLAWLMPSFIHRFISSSMTVFALVMASVSWPVIWLMPSLIMALTAYLWLTEARWLAHSERIRPVSYALTLSGIQLHSLTFFSARELGSMAYERRFASGTDLIPVNEVLLGVVLVLTVAGLLRRHRVELTSTPGMAALAAAVVLALISQQATGLAVAWTLILLGFANGHRVLLGLGLCAFWAYLSRYYYFLHLSLLDKSYLLIMTGLFLLVLRTLGKKWWGHLHA